MPTSTLSLNQELLMTTGLQLFFYVFLIIFTIYSSFLIYHWLSYGTNTRHSLIATALYLLCAAPLLATMGIIAFL